MQKNKNAVATIIDICNETDGIIYYNNALQTLCFRADGLMVNQESKQHRLLAKECFALTVSKKKLITMQKHKQSVSHAHDRKASANIALPNKLDPYTENITHGNTQNYAACQALQHNQPQVWSLGTAAVGV